MKFKCSICGRGPKGIYKLDTVAPERRPQIRGATSNELYFYMIDKREQLISPGYELRKLIVRGVTVYRCLEHNSCLYNEYDPVYVTARRIHDPLYEAKTL